MFSHQVTFVLHRWLSMVTGIYQFILLVKAYNPAPVWRDNSGSLCGLSRLSQSVLQSQKECFYSKELWLVVSIMTFIFHNIWDNPSHWLIFFKMVRTTDQNSGNMRWTSMIGATHTHRHTFQIKWLQQWSHIPTGILEMTTHMIIWLNKNKTSNSIYMVLPCITMYYHHLFFIGISLSLAQKCPSPSKEASMAPEADGKRRGIAGFPGPPQGCSVCLWNDGNCKENDQHR